MTTGTQLEFARVRGLAAAKRAADKAGDEWKLRAQFAIEQFARANPSREFTVEDVRESVKGREDLAEVDARAWGHIIKRAAGANIVEPCGLARTVCSNGSYRVKWRLKR